jgi:hypothetical protein
LYPASNLNLPEPRRARVCRAGLMLRPTKQQASLYARRRGCSKQLGAKLAEKIKKRQFKTGKLGIRISTLSELWNAALAA